MGIADSDLERLFKPFEQLDTALIRKQQGIGLGLVISKKLVNLMKGQIEVSSEVGSGSLFTITLPLSASKTNPLQPQSPPSDILTRLDGIRILAAGDVEINRIILEDLLTEQGYEVIFAEDGEQAINEVENHGGDYFHVALMDIQMPVKDGIEATTGIHQINPELAIIGLTAHAFNGMRQRCLQHGMVAHLTKPLELEALVAAIVKYSNH
ncbi:MAG: two-component system sensor histidine kinase/response regulator [Gammaproteobacteria bacterium]